MKYELFQRLPEIEDFTQIENMQEGAYFLFGQSMIDQKYEKEKGNIITYYQVISNLNGRSLYIPKTEKLE